MEKKTRSMVMKVLLAVVLILAVGIGTALVQENKTFNSQSAPDTEFTWTAPTTGTAVHHYVVEVLINERDTRVFDPVPSESIMLPVVYGNKYRVRVAAVDAAGVQGPHSLWSLPYTPELAPPGF
ncbi:MAG: hypothetical protein ABFS42_04190 [Candidatus Krumholzibacteriota bacterium]